MGFVHAEEKQKEKEGFGKRSSGDNRLKFVSEQHSVVWFHRAAKPPVGAYPTSVSPAQHCSGKGICQSGM